MFGARITQTHTYAVLEISDAAYQEIATMLRSAGYDHAFMDNGKIDMHGLAVASVNQGNVDDDISEHSS